jgi:hypothetical protein
LKVKIFVLILLKVNSFGTRILQHMGFVITKCRLGMLTPIMARKRITDFATFLCNKLVITPVVEFPFWMVDCHPHLLADIDVSATRIAQNVTHSQLEFQHILEWAKAKSSYPTADIEMSEYKLVREAKEKDNYMKLYTASYDIISQGAHNWSKTTPAKHKLFSKDECAFTCKCGSSHTGDNPPNTLCELNTVRGFTLPTWENRAK